MIISVDEFRQYFKTDDTDAVIEAKLAAMETMIRQYTNNNFQRREFRCESAIEDGVILTPSPYFRVGDTIQISGSGINDGLYILGEGDTLTPTPYDSEYNLLTKVVYPADVKMGVVDMMVWKYRNAVQNSGDTDKRAIQSETISRHSVTYANDSTESDIDESVGVPRKYMAFLNQYMKARF